MPASASSAARTMMSIPRSASGLAVVRVRDVADVITALDDRARLQLSAAPLFDELGRIRSVSVVAKRQEDNVAAQGRELLLLSWQDLGASALWPYHPVPAQMWQHLEDLAAHLLVRLDFEPVVEDDVLYLKMWITLNRARGGVKKALQHALRSLYRWMADLTFSIAESERLKPADNGHAGTSQRFADLFRAQSSADQKPATLGDVYKSLKKPTFHYFACDAMDYADSAFSFNFPDEVLTQILTCLDAQSLHQVSCSCKMFRNASVGVIPGLKLRLFEHQFTSVWWMLRRETLPESTPHPAFRQLVSEDGTTVWGNVADGSICDEPVFSTEVRGGLLCDEPGLGKTITCLATVLRTLGSVASTSSQPTDPVTPYGLRSAHNRRRSVKLERTVKSHATLIIVPDALLDHWKTQINMHITPSVLRGVFFDDHPKSPLPDAATLKEFSLVVTTYRRLTSEWLHGRPTCALEERIPITFSEEFQLGGRRRSHEEILEARGLLSEEERLSPLLQIHWFRLVVDEGHALARDAVTHAITMASCIEAERRWAMTGTPTPSASGKEYRHLWNLLKFLRHQPIMRYDGERVWKELVQAPHEQKLLDVRDETAAIISDGLVAQRYSWPVQSILQRIMVRHNKESIEEIPKPIRRLTFLRMSPTERESYNVLVSLAKNNLVVTGLDYKTPGAQHLDSHLNPRNRKFATEAMANIRVACCGGGHSGIFLKDHGFQETMAYLRHRLGLPDLLVNKILAYIRRAESGVSSECEWCNIPLGLLIITPCAHMYCPECMENMGDYCELCRQHFDWNDLQRLQPGFESKDYEFEKPNENPFGTAPQITAEGMVRQYSHEGLAVAAYIVPPASGSDLEPVDAFHLPATSGAIVSSPSAATSSQATPASQMSGQPIALNGASVAQHSDDVSTKAQYVICKIQEIQQEEVERRELIDRHAAAIRSPGITQTALRFGASPRATTGGRRPKLSNLASYGSLASIHDGGSRGGSFQAAPIKVIVFSQFFEFLDRVAIDLAHAGIKFERFWGKKRAHALKRFRILNDVRVLLLTKEGSHGLDLSFVTHIFLMDTIEDRALEEQVISRAYRMGSKQSVVVDQLVMADTIEDDVLLLAHRSDKLYSRLAAEVDRNRAKLRGEDRNPDEAASASTDEDASNATIDEAMDIATPSTSRSAKERQVARLHFLLNSLSLARDRPLRVLPSTRQFAHGKWVDGLLADGDTEEDLSNS